MARLIFNKITQYVRVLYNIFFFFFFFLGHYKIYIMCVGEWGGESRESRLEAWMKSHKSEVAIT